MTPVVFEAEGVCMAPGIWRGVVHYRRSNPESTSLLLGVPVCVGREDLCLFAAFVMEADDILSYPSTETNCFLSQRSAPVVECNTPRICI